MRYHQMQKSLRLKNVSSKEENKSEIENGKNKNRGSDLAIKKTLGGVKTVLMFLESTNNMESSVEKPHVFLEKHV